MLNFLFGLIGLVLGGVVNVLADDLPGRERPRRPHCPDCDHMHAPVGWLAAGRRLFGGGKCPVCGSPARLRPLLVEVGTILLFALLPALIHELPNLVVNSFHIGVLILVIVIDLEHRLILNVVTFPATAVALLGSLVVTNEQNTLPLALVGGATGYALFYIAYWLGQLAFGPGALGMGDVKLAMAMGAMLGFHRVVFALILAILVGGVVSALLLLSRRFNRRSYLPYGQYLALAGIVMLIWGVRVVEWYVN